MAAEISFLDEINACKENGTYTFFPIINSASDRLVEVEGCGEVIMLASCDYLGLSNDERMKEAAKKAIDDFGTNVCGSVVFSGYTRIHYELELSLGEFFGGKEALIFPTSYLANLGCLSSLFGKDDALICDRQNHVSLIHGAQLSSAQVRTYKHGDMNMLESNLRKSMGARKRAIVSDGLFSANGDYANIPEMVRLAEKYDAMLIIDSAHDVGIIGENGCGVAEYYGLLDKVDLIVGTMSKSFGSTGGFIVGSKELIALIQVAGPYHSSRTVSPGVAAASLESLKIMRDEGAIRRKRLNENTKRFLNGVNKLGYNTLSSTSAIVPICLNETSTTFTAASWLKSRGVLVSAFVPPSTPKGWARLRFGVTSKLTESDIDITLRLLSEMKSYLDDVTNDGVQLLKNIANG